jgi:NAD(P)-dependent dehydrogenase (short-subunit alcohol dehydrogenase family)
VAAEITDPLSLSLAGRVALVTGSTKGIGAGIARGMARAGARVVVSGRSRENAERVVDQIRADGGEADYVLADLDRDDDVDALLPAAIGKAGAVDVLVNNAGVDKERLALECELADFRRILRVNLEVPFRLSVATARHLIDRQAKGSIINISSVFGHKGGAEECAYSPAKHGLIGLTKTLAIEWGPLGVRVNAVSPGLIQSDMSQIYFDRGVVGAITGRYPARRAGQPQDLAGAVILLASDAGDFIHGANIMVDGGSLA